MLELQVSSYVREPVDAYLCWVFSSCEALPCGDAFRRDYGLKRSMYSLVEESVQCRKITDPLFDKIW